MLRALGAYGDSGDPRQVSPFTTRTIAGIEAQLLLESDNRALLLVPTTSAAALWQAIERARANRDWRPRPGRICDWCAHQAICPSFGGTPPPIPEDSPQEALPEPPDGTDPV